MTPDQRARALLEQLEDGGQEPLIQGVLRDLLGLVNEADAAFDAACQDRDKLHSYMLDDVARVEAAEQRCAVLQEALRLSLSWLSQMQPKDCAFGYEQDVAKIRAALASPVPGGQHG